MNLEVDLVHQPPRVTLVEADVLDSLKVTVSGDGSREDLAAAIASVGRLSSEGDDAFLDVEELAALGRPLDPEWRSRFDAMVEFARRNDWVDTEGRVQAHLERVPPSGS